MKEIDRGIYWKTESLAKYKIAPRNWFLIRGEDRSLLIDTSIRTTESLAFMECFLEELGITFEKLDIFITHDHPDHTGLVLECQKRGARIFMNSEEARLKNDLLHCYLTDEHSRRENFRIVGVTEEYTPEIYRIVSGYARELSGHWIGVDGFSYIPVNPGETLNYGGYSFEIVLLRGHTFGQCGLYEPNYRLLFCADQIMYNLVPIVGSQQKDMGLLKAYLQSLGELKHEYAQCRIYPAHFEPIDDLPKEADRIICAYLDKCQIMKHLLEENGGEMTTREIGVRAYGKDDSPPPPELFKTCTMIWAKTFSCLEYLYTEGFVKRTEHNGVLYWKA